ncbi:MAG: flagellar basal body L-ring protein FlgH, partial [Pseudomonadota bacterium]
MGHVTTTMFLCLSLVACGRGDHIGKAPSFSNPLETREHSAMVAATLPLVLEQEAPTDRASLWSGQRSSLLGDRRAVQRGDIMTVVIEIDESAEISNETERSRNGSESLQLPQLAGLSQRLDDRLPEGATSADLVSINSSSGSGGDGSVKREEKLTLRVAATVVDVLPDGV